MNDRERHECKFMNWDSHFVPHRGQRQSRQRVSPYCIKRKAVPRSGTQSFEGQIMAKVFNIFKYFSPRAVLKIGEHHPGILQF